MSQDSPKVLHVAVGVIKNQDGKILISLRHDSAHQGGLWEFPGGKIEPAETVEQALTRELKEELNINILKFSPLITVRHDYPDLSVFLNVWEVLSFSGEAVGREQQLITWVSPEQLDDYCFPEANYPIVNAVRLPTEYAILNAETVSALLVDLNKLIGQGIKLVQARIKSLSADEVVNFFETAIPLCQDKGVILLINSAAKGSHKVNVTGIHLTANDLLKLTQRPFGYNWVAASCHNLSEALHAEKIGVDFIVLAPVLQTATHPQAEPMGWAAFERLTHQLNLPVYALGGMKKSDIKIAKSVGAQGISGISLFKI